MCGFFPRKLVDEMIRYWLLWLLGLALRISSQLGEGRGKNNIGGFFFLDERG